MKKSSFIFASLGLSLFLSSCAPFSTFTHPVTDPKPLMACDCDEKEKSRMEMLRSEGEWLTPLTPH